MSRGKDLSLKQIILGTAGHIDHGKTTLIKALTGIDTDRLKEEKLKGITIELGFAWLDLPNQQRVGIVDVPGHEKFVKNMVAGATGIDLVALIIAADEGVMPQTREHLEICRLLGVTHGLVALTKIDLVDEEWLQLVIEDVKSFLKGTFLQGSPVVPVSSVTGQGLPEFIESLLTVYAMVPKRRSTGLLRLPVDRVFTMKGFGTVVTGSLVSGKVRVGETVMIYPSEIESKVRGIQVHNQPVAEATAGVRTAINFQGLERRAINRGDVVGRAGTLKPSYMIDVMLEYLSSNKKPLRNRCRVRFHTGTSEIFGYPILLDRDELKPGEETVVQLRLEAPVSVVKDDRFVIRSYSPVRTIGGGRILNPIAGKHKRFKGNIVADLMRLANGTTGEIVSYYLKESGLRGVRFSDLILMTNLAASELEKELQKLLSEKAIIQVDRENRIFIHRTVFDGLCENVLQILKAYHKENSLRPGMPRETLNARLPRKLSPRLLNVLLQELSRSNRVVQEKDTIRLSGFRIALEANQKDIRRKIEQVYLQSGLQPPHFKELAESIGKDSAHIRDVFVHMLDEGVLVKVKDGLYFHIDVIEKLRKRLISYLKDNGEISTPEFKELTGVTRKYMIPLLEYFDATKLTIRVGDVRRLRER